MPAKKKKYNARFPALRIKKIMQRYKSKAAKQLN